MFNFKPKRDNVHIKPLVKIDYQQALANLTASNNIVCEFDPRG